MSTKLKKISIIILLCIFFALPFYNIFSVDFVDGHDFLLHFHMIHVLEKILKKGILLPRWLPNATYGYGTPVFTFMWAVPYYLGAFLHLAGLSYQEVFKILILFPNVLSGIGFFLWIKPKYGNFIAAVSAIVYIFAPYRFLDSFIRCALGELFFFAFLPFVFLFLDRAKSKKELILGSFFAALMIYSHQGLSLIGYPLLISYILLQFVKDLHSENRLRNSLKSVIPSEEMHHTVRPEVEESHTIQAWVARDSSMRALRLVGITTPPKNINRLRNQLLLLTGGLLLTFFYWVPVIAYRSFLSIREGKIKSIWFPPLFSLIRSKWEGGSVLNGKRLIMSFQIGLGQLGIIFLSHLYLIHSIIKKKKKTIHIIFWLSFFWLSIFFMQPVSKWFWINTPLIINLQFPFRLLFIPMLTTSVTTALILSLTKKPWRYLLGYLFVLAVIVANRNHLRVLNKEVDLKTFNTYQGTYDVGGEKLPKYVSLQDIKKNVEKNGTGEEFTIVSGKGKIISQERKDYQSHAEIEMEEEGKLNLRRIYFPGWQIYRNGQKTKNFEKGNGIFLTLPKGKSEIKAEYKDPSLVTFSNTISLVSFIILATLLLTRSKKVIKVK